MPDRLSDEELRTEKRKASGWSDADTIRHLIDMAKVAWPEVARRAAIEYDALKAERDEARDDLAKWDKTARKEIAALREREQRLRDELGRESQRCERAEGQVQRLQEALAIFWYANLGEDAPGWALDLWRRARAALAAADPEVSE